MEKINILNIIADEQYKRRTARRMLLAASPLQVSQELKLAISIVEEINKGEILWDGQYNYPLYKSNPMSKRLI